LPPFDHLGGGHELVSIPTAGIANYGKAHGSRFARQLRKRRRRRLRRCFGGRSRSRLWHGAIGLRGWLAATGENR
jgi:hypothetical protein